MCRKRGREQAEPVEKPRINNTVLKSMMNRAAHGEVDALLGLSTQLSRRVDNNLRRDRTEDENRRIEEVSLALAWATQQAWRKKRLKHLSSSEVEELMNDALRGDDIALERLQLLGKEVDTLSGAEANLVAHFVEAKQAK